MTSPHWACCCTNNSCCDIWDCLDGVCDNYEIVVTWEINAIASGQTMLLSRATYRYTTQGTRTTGPDDLQCPEGTPSYYSWDEVNVEVLFEAFDWISSSQSACFENTSPTQWQTTAQVVGGITPAECAQLAEDNIGCVGWPNAVAVKQPGITFYRQYQTRTWDYQGVIDSTDCFDDLDPIELKCIDACGKCKRASFKLYCPNFDQTGWPVINGTYNFRQTPECDPDVVDDPATYGVEPFEIYSDCLCNGKPPWKDGRLGMNFDQAHFAPWMNAFTPFVGTIDAQVATLAAGICDELNDGERRTNFKLDYAWSCSRPALGENCPNSDAVYDEIVFQMPVQIKLNWNVTVNCL